MALGWLRRFDRWIGRGFGALQGLLFMLAFFLVGLTAIMVWWVPFLTHATTGR